MEHIPGVPKERLPTIEVGNTVIWANADMKAPFDIRIGERSPFGVLLALPGETDPAGFPGIPREDHWRTLDVGQAYFEDTEHRLYRDVDIKGTGLLHPRAHAGAEPGQWFANRAAGGGASMDVRGLLDRDDALHDADMAERFTALGIRTHRALAIVKLEELNVGTKRIPVDQLKAEKKLHPDFYPVVEARAFGVKTRTGDLFSLRRAASVKGQEYIERLRSMELRDLLSESQIAAAKKEIGDALAFLEKEQGRPFSKEEYVHWFLGEIGRAIGIMHDAGYAHQWLHAQNVTLDARLTDFDSVYRLADFDLNPELTPAEREEEKETLIYNDINFDPTFSRTGILSWLEAYVTYLKKLYPEELETTDATRTNAEFFESYAKQLTTARMREIFVLFMKGNDIELPQGFEEGA